jgi:hypothetical protein
MGNKVKKLTMDQPANYQIKVPGVLSEHRSDWGVRMEITVKRAGHISQNKTITGNIYQVALLGILRQLNSLGLPLISVNCIDFKELNDELLDI